MATSTAAEMPIRGAMVSLSQKVGRVASLQQSLLAQIHSLESETMTSRADASAVGHSRQPEEPTLRAIMLLFALVLAPFVGVLVGGWLVQQFFGWDAAPVYHAFLCASVGYILYQYHGGRDPLQSRKSVPADAPRPTTSTSTHTVPEAISERFKALRALLEDVGHKRIGPSQIDALDACLEFIAVANHQSIPVGCPAEKQHHPGDEVKSVDTGVDELATACATPVPSDDNAHSSAEAVNAAPALYQEAEKLSRLKRFAQVSALLEAKLPSAQPQWDGKANRVWATAKMQEFLQLTTMAKRKRGPAVAKKRLVALLTDALAALTKAKAQNPNCPLSLMWSTMSNLLLASQTGGVNEKIAAGKQFHGEVHAALALLEQGHFPRPDHADEDEAAAVEQKIRSFGHFLLATYYYQAANLPWALRMAAQVVVTLPTMTEAVEVFEVSFRESTDEDSKKEKAYKIAKIYAKNIKNKSLATKWKREAAQCVDPDPEENDWFNTKIKEL